MTITFHKVPVEALNFSRRESVAEEIIIGGKRTSSRWEEIVTVSAISDLEEAGCDLLTIIRERFSGFEGQKSENEQKIWSGSEIRDTIEAQKYGIGWLPNRERH